MNPIAMFKGWRDRRWCRKWGKANGRDVDVVREYNLHRSCYSFPPRMLYDYGYVIEYDSEYGRVVAESVFIYLTEAAAWSALRRELEKQ